MKCVSNRRDHEYGSENIVLRDGAEMLMSPNKYLLMVSEPDACENQSYLIV